MNNKEKRVLQLTSELWNAILELEQYHPDDINALRFHIHGIQNTIMSREAIRNNPGLFLMKESSRGSSGPQVRGKDSPVVVSFPQSRK